MDIMDISNSSWLLYCEQMWCFNIFEFDPDIGFSGIDSIYLLISVVDLLNYSLFVCMAGLRHIVSTQGVRELFICFKTFYFFSTGFKYLIQQLNLVIIIKYQLLLYLYDGVICPWMNVDWNLYNNVCIYLFVVRFLLCSLNKT